MPSAPMALWLLVKAGTTRQKSAAQARDGWENGPERFEIYEKSLVT
ncbi:hypothetical protein BDE40_2115 [Litoreibacter halocynthiae]|uniref:Uncharacterized protein n=1 Tax=Litoreibacter halocynthiae TaxID=1242689 RepID=A0A4R7LL11_9RHOB|nr:hypothetical protein BDE40_2115 [Litoreibacter halocynthiae]